VLGRGPQGQPEPDVWRKSSSPFSFWAKTKVKPVRGIILFITFDTRRGATRAAMYPKLVRFHETSLAKNQVFKIDFMV